MKKSSWAVATLCIVLAAVAQVASAQSLHHDWVLVCNGESKWFPRNADLELMQRTFGKANVREAGIELGEGETAPGIEIYPAKPSQRIELAWADAAHKKGIDFVAVEGKKSLWHTCEGITLGTDLKTLERLNGRAFSLRGFEWDYPGDFVSWRNGKLAKPLRDVFLRMDRASAPAHYYDQVAGDSVFLSNTPAMQGVNPVVYKLGLAYKSP